MKSNSFCPAVLASAPPQSIRATRWLALLVLASITFRVTAADVVWDGGVSGTGSAWTTTANWNPDGVPTGADNAIFDSVQGVTLYTLNSLSQQVGCVTVGSGRTANFSIRSLSSASGILQLNGVGGILISNNSSAALTFQNTATWATSLKLNLGASGIIYAGNNGAVPPGTAGSVNIISQITESGGSRSLTLTGPGIVSFQTNNSYSGSTTVSNGTLQVDDQGTIGDGNGTLFLSGGNIRCDADRSGTSSAEKPISNPIVLAADAYLYNRSGTANTSRRLPLSGTLGGTNGTLKIANPTTAPNQTFIVRLFGTFTFGRPILIGETAGSYSDLVGSYSVLELCNSNGVQTLTGNISGPGRLLRANPLNLTAAGGSSVLTGSNTYSGGTSIGSGTVFANNSSGSALGSGTVIVTNLGTLAGSGSVVAAMTISNNATISPGSLSTNVGALAISDLTFGPGATYLWNLSAATGTPGVNWDVINASSSWTDAATSSNPVTIKVDSLGIAPSGWNPAVARTWTIISSSTANAFDLTHFAIDTTAFVGSAPGIFALSVSSGSLVLSYTPASDIIINVTSGSVDQGGTSPTPYPLLTGAVGVQKVGNGEVVFTNSANNYQGSTKIYAGTLSLATDANNGSGAFGTGTTAAQLGFTAGNSNATLNINTPGVTLGRAVQVQAGSTGIKTIGTTISSGTANFLGDITLQDSAALMAAAGGAAVFSGNITGSGGLSLAGAGTITIAAANSYTGPTTVTVSNLNLNDKGFGTNTVTFPVPFTLDNTAVGSVTLNASPLNLNADIIFTGTTNLNLGSGPVSLGGNRALTVNASTLTLGGIVSGNAGLLKLGSGTLALNGSTNTYTGGTTNSAGTLAVNGTGTFGNGTGTLVLNGGNILNTGSRSSLPIANPVLMSADTTIYGNSTVAAPSTRVIPFSGNWNVASGTLRIGNTGLAGNTFTLRLTAGNNITWPVIIGDNGFDTPGSISTLSLGQDSNAPVQIVNGTISGTGGIVRGHLIVGAGGTSIFTGNNAYAGGTVLSSGTLGIGLNSTPTSGTVTSGPLGIGTFETQNDPVLNIFAFGGARTIANKVYFYGGTNIAFTGTNALVFNGAVDVGTTGRVLTVSSTAPVTFNGALTNVAALTKRGSGILIFSGDNSTRTNATSVSAGTLLINNTSGSGTGAGVVNVNSGGTLGGDGLIGGALNVNSGGTLAPGNLAIGTLTLTNGLTLAGNVAIEVNTSASPSNDLVAVTGLLTNISGSTLTVSNLGPVLAVGNKFTVFSQPVLNGDALTISGGGVTWSNRLALDGSIVVIPTPVSSAPSFATGGVTVSGGGVVSLTATGALGGTFKLWASTNLALTPVTNTWTLLQSGTISSNPFTILDNSATNFPRRFYLFTAP